MEKKYRVAEIGTFDVENYGDLLFPVVLKGQLDDYEIDLFSPNGGKMPFSSDVDVYKIEELETHILEKHYHAIIIGGGDLIRVDKYVASSYASNEVAAILLWQYPIMLAKKYHIPILFNVPGVPYSFKKCERGVIKTLLEQVDYLAVRDENSKKILEECGLNSIIVCPDTVFSIDDIIQQEQLIELKKRLEDQHRIPELDHYIVFQHNRTHIDDDAYILELKKLISLINETYHYPVVFVPIGYVHHDIDFLEKLYDEENSDLYLIKEKLSPLEMLALFSQSDGYIGTSMHGAITSYVYGKPILVINTVGMVKMNGFLKEIDKLDIEVKDIYRICDIFEEKFFEIGDQKIFQGIKDRIHTHFDTMKQFVETLPVEDKKIGFELAFLTSVFEGLESVSEPQSLAFTIYFDDGLGFRDEFKKQIFVDLESKQVSFDISVPKNVSSVRIDPLEGYVIKYDKLSVSGSEKLEVSVLSSLDFEDNHYILSLDPQIVVSNVADGINIQFSMEYDFVSLAEILDITKKLHCQNDELMEKAKYEELYKNTLEYRCKEKLKRFTNKS